MRSLYHGFLASLVALLLMALASAPAHAQCGPWQIVDSPNPGVTFNNLQGIKALAADDIWSVGYHKNNGVDPGYRTLVVHWNGSVWDAVPSPNPGVANHALEAIDGAAADDLWAVGYADDGDENARQPLALHWDGAEWAAAPNSGNTLFSSLACYNTKRRRLLVPPGTRTRNW